MSDQEYKDWLNSAEKELKDRGIEDLNWQTPEGIEVKPLYTVDDIKNLNHKIGFPGLPPFTRGPRATMYANRPWTIRQYAGFSTAEESNKFYKEGLKNGVMGDFHQRRVVDHLAGVHQHHIVGDFENIFQAVADE